MMYPKVVTVLLAGVIVMLALERFQNQNLSKELSVEQNRNNDLRVHLNTERERAARERFKANGGFVPVALNETRAKWVEGWDGGSLVEGTEKDLYSSSHCIGNSEKHTKDDHAWLKSTCRFKNLCYDPSTENFLYYKKPEDDFDIRSSVAMGPVNAQWEKSHQMLMRWLPQVIDGPLTEPYFTTSDEEVWVPHFEHCAANVMHLIMDSFYPWHGAVTLFGIEKHIKPLRIVLKNMTLWGTCDYVKQEKDKGEGWAQWYYTRCTTNQEKWLPAMLPAENGVPVKQLHTTRDYLKEGVNGTKRLVCFKDAVVGVGMLSDHCLKAHGWSWDKSDIADHDCNQGRGHMLWSFRKRMMMVAGVQLEVPKSHKVLLFSFGTRGGPNWQAYHTLLQRRLGDGVKVESARLGTAKEQMEQIQTATAAVAAMGGNTVTALFLPRGAGLLLLHDGKDRLDWDFWTHASHISVAWLPAASLNTTQQIGATVQQMLINYEDFSPFQ